MALSSGQILSVVEIVLYIPMVPFTLYLARKHGRTSILGYFYLHVFSLLRIVADIVELVEQPTPAGQPSLLSIILSSVGLSPLMLGVSGFLHEIHVHVYRSTVALVQKRKIISRWLWFVQLNFHTICAIGMILLIIGGVHLSEATSISDVQNAKSLREAGVMILEVLSICLIFYSVWLQRKCAQLYDQLNVKTAELSTWSLAAVILVEVKVIYAILYVFDENNAALNPVTGSLAVKVILVVLVPFFAVLLLTTGGWRSRNIAHDTPYISSDGNALQHMYGPIHGKGTPDRLQIVHATDNE